jgi:uncharacterized protein YbjT (DUF2867 family)
MLVSVIGSTRGTGRLLVSSLLDAGHDVRAVVRNGSAREDLEAAGAEVVPGDLEGDLDGVFEGADAVAFCAGSGSSTGPDATLRVDLHGAVRTVDLAKEAGVERYVMLSSMAADDPLRGSEKIQHYLAAKHAADRILAGSGLASTIVRPGGLTDDTPTGRVRFGVPRLDERGQISRADVAAVMAACLDDDTTIGCVFEAVNGSVPIEDAVDALGGGR